MKLKLPEWLTRDPSLTPPDDDNRALSRVEAGRVLTRPLIENRGKYGSQVLLDRLNLTLNPGHILAVFPDSRRNRR